MIAPRVTDHALLRYIERVYGVDVEALRLVLAAKLARGVTAAANIVGRPEDARFKTGDSGGEFRILTDGLTFICREDRVVTVVVRK